jgi:hypothetical protein
MDLDLEPGRQNPVEMPGVRSEPLNGVAGRRGDLKEHIVVGAVGRLTTNTTTKPLTHSETLSPP